MLALFVFLGVSLLIGRLSVPDGQSALRLKARLLFRLNTVLSDLPYRVGSLRR